MEDPELLLGFRRDGDLLVVIGPDGESKPFGREDLFDEILRRVGADGRPQVVSRNLDATEEQLRSAYGVLYDFVRARATYQVGEGVVAATETVVKRAHTKAEQALSKAPRGPSRKYELRRRAREAYAAKQAGGGGG